MKAGRSQKNKRRIKQTKPMPGDEEDDGNYDLIPLDIMRLAREVSGAWRRCHRRACQRGRACRFLEECTSVYPPRKPSNNPEKERRDEERSLAIFQRRLTERMQELDQQESAQTGETTPQPKARRQRRQ